MSMDETGDENTGADDRGEWLRRLKGAYEAGYYRTEAAEDEQEPFPWQNRTCGDCPFWMRNTCLVREARRGAGDATCKYFDPWNYPEAVSIIQYNRIPSTFPGDDQAA